MEKVISQYIQKEILNSDQNIDNDEGLLESGLVDSIGMMRIVSFIEQHYQVKVEPMDLVIENFESINAIVQFLKMKIND